MTPEQKVREQLPAFEAWLTAQGIEVDKFSHDWTISRFKTVRGWHTLYHRANGVVTMTGEMPEAWEAFKGRRTWTPLEALNQPGQSFVQPPAKARVPRPLIQPTPSNIQRLLARDGQNCWLCLEPLGNDITLEHLCPAAHGGPNHMSNYALAHAKCNKLLDSKPVAEKVRMREAKLLKELPPW